MEVEKTVITAAAKAEKALAEKAVAQMQSNLAKQAAEIGSNIQANTGRFITSINEALHKLNTIESHVRNAASSEVHGFVTAVSKHIADLKSHLEGLL